MRLASVSRGGLSALLVGLLCALSGCGGEAPAATPGSSTSPPGADLPVGARDQLAAQAALARDRHYAALYSWDTGDGAPRNVVATSANDGTWRVDVANAALGGTANVSITRTAAGLFQCSLSSPTRPVTPTCVKVADPGRRVPKRYDPRVQHVFQDWPEIFTDRQAALAVSAVRPLPGVRGDCYAVDSTTAALRAVVDIGIYCYSADGMLTAARVEYGVLKLVSEVPGPATVQLPGPEVAGVPMEMASPSVPPVAATP